LGYQSKDCGTGLNLLYRLEDTLWKASNLSVFNALEIFNVAVAEIMKNQGLIQDRNDTALGSA